MQCERSVSGTRPTPDEQTDRSCELLRLLDNRYSMLLQEDERRGRERRRRRRGGEGGGGGGGVVKLCHVTCVYPLGACGMHVQEGCGGSKEAYVHLHLHVCEYVC